MAASSTNQNTDSFSVNYAVNRNYDINYRTQVNIFEQYRNVSK